MLFERLNTMKTSCIERFVKWFSYHLSNFQFTWAWQDWISCLDENPESPKIKFIRETLQRCMRLSFHQRVIDFVPEQFYKLVPNKPSPVYKFEDADPPLFGSEYAQLLTKKIRERSAPEELLRVLNTVPNPSKEDQASASASSSSVANQSSADLTYSMVQIDLFSSSLLWVGSKSFTHSFVSLAKYHSLFKILIETEEQQIQVLKSMYDIWQNHQQMMVVLVDKLVKTQIVECSAVANWIFSSELSSELTNFYVWEILTSTIEKMNRQVDKYHNELLDLRRQLNITSTVQAVTRTSTTNVDVNPAKEQTSPSTEEKPLDDNKMDESENTDATEEKPTTTTTTTSLKRRHESDDDEDEGDDEEKNSSEKIQSMHITQPPMDEATAKLHEKYEMVEERLTHAREQQK